MNLPLELAAQVEAATGFVKSRWDRSPRFGIILGTGAGELAEAIEAEEKIPYGEVPHLLPVPPPATKVSLYAASWPAPT